MRDRPEDAGTTAYGAEDAPPATPHAPRTESPARVAIRTLLRGLEDPVTASL